MICDSSRCSIQAGLVSVLNMSILKVVLSQFSLLTTVLSLLENSEVTRNISMCSEERVDSCRTGLFCRSGERCECGNYPPDIILCNERSPLFLDFICATFNAKDRVIKVGACMYNSGMKGPGGRSREALYNPLPADISNLTHFMCGRFRRNGTLCGRCLPNYYPQAYSYNLTCIKCSNLYWKWGKYIVAAYLPLTVFYFIILFLKINVTSSFLLAIVMYCQGIASPILIRLVLTHLHWNPNSTLTTSVKFLFSIYGIWNLDFFRPFYSDICLGIGVLPTLALEYVIALYPFLLMIITYLLIVLYDKNYKVIRFLWRPFQAVFSLFRKNWNIRTSVIDAYATFFLLSHMKLLCVSFDLLIPVRVYDLHRDYHKIRYGLYHAADIHYFGSEHHPFAILASSILLVFGFLPIVILALYPFAFFQRLLNRFPFRWYVLHTFMDPIQGCYKDGTEPGTRDCRWFSSTYFLCRLLLFMLYGFDLNIATSLLSAFILLLYSFLCIVVQPFKNSLVHYNRIYTVFILLPALFCVLITGVGLSTGFMHELFNLFTVLAFTIGFVPLVCTIFMVACWVFTNGLCSQLVRRFRAWRNGYELLDERMAEQEGSSVSDGIEKSDAYPKQDLSSLASVRADS